VDYVYLRADGIHVNIRLEEHKLCLLVMIGVHAGGRARRPTPGGHPRYRQAGWWPAVTQYSAPRLTLAAACPP
jgi:hypothetical protein